MSLGTATIKKSVGILRYTFGDAPVPGARAGLFGGDNPVILTCLGADSAVNPDMDDHVFGCSPGHAAINGAANTLFAGTSILSMNDADINGPRIAAASNHRATQRIPAAAKVWARFQATNGVLSVGLAPFVVVQTEVVQNGLFSGGVENTGAEGQSAETTRGDWRIGVFLSSIRIAIKNIGSENTVASGVLVVGAEWSGHELPGNPSQDANFTASAPGGL